MKEIHRGVLGNWEEQTILEHAFAGGSMIYVDAWIDEHGKLVVTQPSSPELIVFPAGLRARIELESAVNALARFRLKTIRLL